MLTNASSFFQLGVVFKDEEACFKSFVDFKPDGATISCLNCRLPLDFVILSLSGELRELASSNALFLVNENRFTKSGFGFGDKTGGREVFSADLGDESMKKGKNNYNIKQALALMCKIGF